MRRWIFVDVDRHKTFAGGSLMSRALRLHRDDNVAILIDEGIPGPLEVFGEPLGGTVEIVEPIARGHKSSIVAISAGEAIVKYGVPIGLATVDIPVGAWVHTHNCRSRYDERSQSLDRHTGAPTDIEYE